MHLMTLLWHRMNMAINYCHDYLWIDAVNGLYLNTVAAAAPHSHGTIDDDDVDDLTILASLVAMHFDVFHAFHYSLYFGSEHTDIAKKVYKKKNKFEDLYSGRRFQWLRNYLGFCWEEGKWISVDFLVCFHFFLPVKKRFHDSELFIRTTWIFYDFFSRFDRFYVENGTKWTMN